MTGVNDDEPGGRELLRVEGVTKSFPGVRALDGVDLSLRTGEVHVLLGENGAGKSTLIKMLSGAHRPDGGRLLVDGDEATIRSAQDAERCGIATIYQEFNLVPGLTVAENIFLGLQPRTKLGLVDKKTMRTRAAELLRRVRLDVSPDTPVAELGIARLQMVEIAKALSLDARALIMDEPTAVLTSEEVETLFEIVRELRDTGVGIIFITHHLEEIGALGDRVTVLRDGRSVAEVLTDGRGRADPPHGGTGHRRAVPAAAPRGAGRPLAARPRTDPQRNHPGRAGLRGCRLRGAGR